MDSAIRTQPRWRVYLKLSRISNLPTIWTNAIAATVLAGSEPSGTAFIATVVGLSLVYTAGMFLNDAFDSDFDRRFRKDRPIPAGEIGSREVFAVGFGLLALGEGAFLFRS